MKLLTEQRLKDIRETSKTIDDKVTRILSALADCESRVFPEFGDRLQKVLEKLHGRIQRMKQKVHQVCHGDFMRE
jgi:hypothetical protein